MQAHARAQKLCTLHGVDPDLLLDEEDIRAIAQARREKAEGTLVSWEALKEELGVHVGRRAR